MEAWIEGEPSADDAYAARTLQEWWESGQGKFVIYVFRRDYSELAKGADFLPNVTEADANAAGQCREGATTNDERRSARTQRQEKANLLREAKLKLVEKYLDDEPTLRDLDYRGLSAVLKQKGLLVNPSFLSRNLRNTKYDRGRASGNPHRAAPGNGEREAVAVDDAADLSELDAWTTPDQHT